MTALGAPWWLCSSHPGSTDLIGIHQSQPQQFPFLLSSTDDNAPNGRFDILFAFPGESLELTADGTVLKNGQKHNNNDFLNCLDQAWSVERRDPVNQSPVPFMGGWFLFFGYELVKQIETGLNIPSRPAREPVALAIRTPAAIVVDHETENTYLICEQEYADLLPELGRSLSAKTKYSKIQTSPPLELLEDDPELFLAGMQQIQRYIREGDVFQVNLSRAWVANFSKPVDPVGLFQELCRSNPAPFAGLVQWGDDFAIVSSSPERLLEVRNDGIRTRPIAGTYPRGREAREDAELKRGLVRHPKERAEHVMLIDLERNDLGRVCRPGSVQVKEFMAVESYRHVHHIVSEVGGTLNPDIKPSDVIRAVFPGGTITGCPKVRCMEIIAELEQIGRGMYTGAMGYLNRDGSMDLNILIRSMCVTRDRVEFRAGAGIVADSVPLRELSETRNKAHGMLDALSLL